MRRLKIRPALHKLAVRDAPDDDAAELVHVPCRGFGALPCIADYDLVALGDEVLNSHVQVREFDVSSANVGLGTGRAGRRARRNVRAVVHKLRREVYVCDVEVLAVHELLKVVADEGLHLGVGHAG